MNSKAQGTTEYLIILAVIIVIALVVVGVLGWFPGLSTGISMKQSNAYWQSTHPISILQSKLLTDGSMALEIQNKTMNKIIIHSLTINGITVYNRGEGYDPHGLEKARKGFVQWSLTRQDLNDVNCVFSAGEKNGLNIIHSDDLPDCTAGEIKSFTLKFVYSVVKGISNKTFTGQKELLVECTSGSNPAYPTQYIS